ncbi:MAG: helix-turn-helix transcriptional regulator [Liquorilactobacillus nagelii]|uniref:helix-turn-helix domain-containing protein n=1 Tax=Liquorilactobacillus satsumensis TaxID=259059 RepID=UPI0039E82FE6
MLALKKARERKKLTQKEAAKAIGISFSMLTKMESGYRGASMETMRKVSDFYGESVDDLFFAIFNH